MKYTIFLALLIAFSSCKKEGCTDSKATNFNDKAKKDDGSCLYPTNKYNIPTTYQFLDASGISTVNYQGQLDRLEQIRQIISKMDQATTGVIQAQDLKDMFANTSGNGNGNFNFTSTKQLKDKCFSLDQTLIEAWMDSLAANSVFYNQNASLGVAGTLMVEGSLHLFSSKGVEYAEKIEKALMGAVQMYQALDVYLSSSKLNLAENSTKLSGTNYTEMEHYFDEAFGYFGVSTDFPTTVPSDLWGEYCNNQNANIGSNASMMNNFLAGRAAITNKAFTDRDNAVLSIKNTWENLTAHQAMDYLDEAMANLGNTGLFFHALTEAHGFVYNLRFAPDESRNLSQTELNIILDKFGSDYWNINLSTLQNIKADLDAKY